MGTRDAAALRGRRGKGNRRRGAFYGLSCRGELVHAPDLPPCPGRRGDERLSARLALSGGGLSAGGGGEPIAVGALTMQRVTIGGDARRVSAHSGLTLKLANLRL